MRVVSVQQRDGYRSGSFQNGWNRNCNITDINDNLE